MPVPTLVFFCYCLPVPINRFPGALDEDGTLIEDRNRGMSREDVLQIPDSCLYVIKNTETRGKCDNGQIYYYDEPIGGPGHVYLTRGPNIMVESESLSILSLATGGRMTPQRLWRMAMYEGWSFPYAFVFASWAVSNSTIFKGLDGIYYGEIRMWWGQYPEPIPQLAVEQLLALEELGDVDLVRQAIIHQGGLWRRMRPDR